MSRHVKCHINVGDDDDPRLCAQDESRIFSSHVVGQYQRHQRARSAVASDGALGDVRIVRDARTNSSWTSSRDRENIVSFDKARSPCVDSMRIFTAPTVICQLIVAAYFYRGFSCRRDAERLLPHTIVSPPYASSLPKGIEGGNTGPEAPIAPPINRDRDSCQDWFFSAENAVGEADTPPRDVDFSRRFPSGEAQTGLGTMTIKPRLLSFLQGDAGQGGEMEPIVEDVRVYVPQYAAAFSLAV
ncbi:hypothetical protein EAG_15240 [Camponotus floridanus]|uniref:Uncharacterized protein n=1 Tax=Camponotus floridanus TaxID=104421 RepID=E2A082_CAMFO|nr:hypothetical protein EAG_15240 [Camponotus floridanus]